MGCFYCEQGSQLDELMIPICELEYSRVYLVRNQNYPGRCVVEYKDHVHELFQLTPDQLAGYTAELALTAGVLYNMYQADKINYGIYGDNVPHLHCHVIPKRRDGYTWGAPFSLAGNDNYPSQEELQQTATSIRDAILSAK